MKIRLASAGSLRLAVLFLAGWAVSAAVARGEDLPRVKTLRVTILSTMLADLGQGPRSLGEWGFAALVEADGHRILFDTGAHSDVVLRNAEATGVDLTTVPDVLLSHSHWDHVGGLMALRESVVKKAPAALARVHVGEGIFYPRLVLGTGLNDNPALLLKPDYEKSGGVFIVHAKAEQIFPGVWVTGPVPRRYPERNWNSEGVKLVSPGGEGEDNLPEDMSLVCDTDAGLVVITGCGHAGIVNIVEHARQAIRPARVHALIGGLHLFNASENTLQWTAQKLNEAGVDYFLGAHCTGLETVFRYRHDLHLDRAHAVVAAVGAKFELGHGLEPGLIAR